MCIYCSDTERLPVTMAMKRDGSNFFCVYCETDDSCEPELSFQVGEEVMHEQEGLCIIVDAWTYGSTYEIVPLVDNESGFSPAITVNACELAQA